jgi:membrane glycosyltransferase
MNAPDTAHDGMPADALFNTMTVAPRRRRTLLERVRRAWRHYLGTGVFLAMLVVCVGLVALSR